MAILLRRHALGISAAAALLAGCAQGAPPAASAAAAHLMRETGEVQYFSNFNDSTLVEFDYPKSESEIGQITGVAGAQGECTKGARTFWSVASGSNAIEEFKAGGTSPIATLTESTGEPISCAIDPTTGDLAVTILSDGNVVLYQNAKGSGTVMSTPLIEAYFDGYDAKGNLFADGFNSKHAFQLVELPKGSSSFKAISISNTIKFPASVQWDGSYLTIGDGSGDIYRYQVVARKAKLKGTVSLTSGDCVATWIANRLGLVFCANGIEGLVYNYPAGGPPVADLSGSGFNFPVGVVSLRAR
jgi:hypothetical protein